MFLYYFVNNISIMSKQKDNPYEVNYANYMLEFMEFYDSHRALCEEIAQKLSEYHHDLSAAIEQNQTWITFFENELEFRQTRLAQLPGEEDAENNDRELQKIDELRKFIEILKADNRQYAKPLDLPPLQEIVSGEEVEPEEVEPAAEEEGEEEGGTPLEELLAAEFPRRKRYRRKPHRREVRARRSRRRGDWGYEEDVRPSMRALRMIEEEEQKEQESRPRRRRRPREREEECPFREEGRARQREYHPRKLAHFSKLPKLTRDEFEWV